jgi:hypothetical protein
MSEGGMVWGEDGRPHPPPTVEPADDSEGGG